MVPDWRSPNQKSDETNKLNRLFGERLKNLRVAHGYSQQKFAEIINRSQSVVSSWELGRSAPDLGNLFMLSEALGAPVTSLLPLEESGDSGDIDRQILDLVHQDPRWGVLFDKRGKMSEQEWSAVFGVMSAILKERDSNV